MSQPAIVGLPPAVSAFISGIKPSLNVLLVCAVWLGVAIPLLFILFWSSPSSSRRGLLFIFNVISICIGILMGVLNVIILLKSITDPIKGVSRSAMLPYVFLTVAADIFIDSILLFRVFAVFPREFTRRSVLYVVFGPLLLLKICRITNVVVFMVDFARMSRDFHSSSQLGPLSARMPQSKIGWGLQLLDNVACSSIFLWRLNQVQSLSLRVRSGDGKSSYPTALRALFWISTSNFIFPSIFAIIQYVLIFRDPDPTHFLIVMISNVYVEIIGVLFATVWVGTKDYKTPSSSMHPHTLQFAATGDSVVMSSLSPGRSTTGDGIQSFSINDGMTFINPGKEHTSSSHS